MSFPHKQIPPVTLKTGQWMRCEDGLKREGFYRVRLRRVRSCLKESKQTSAYRARHRLSHNPPDNRGNIIIFLPFWRLAL
ncbi:unnamed protein product [Penicillium roqueforti FM164]|uniref:Genomic scaffold, ProqFM164S01 n=1 Tax=Penicillium roqueforti (strain FM164) TaxID=1365484 RepID=W6PRR2_PENRF|nr:unnamed protein product [Penicillium roqueforti FM164]